MRFVWEWFFVCESIVQKKLQPLLGSRIVTSKYAILPYKFVVACRNRWLLNEMLEEKGQSNGTSKTTSANICAERNEALAFFSRLVYVHFLYIDE